MRIGRGTDVFVENLPQCHFVHHKSNVTWPGIKPGLPEEEASDYLPVLYYIQYCFMVLRWGIRHFEIVFLRAGLLGSS
jgi:hypothetical protein